MPASPFSRLMAYAFSVVAFFQPQGLSAQEQNFRKVELAAAAPVFEHAAAMRLIPADGRALVVHVRDDDRRHAFEIYNARDLNAAAPKPSRVIAVPRNAVFYAIGEQPEGEADALLILTETGVQRYDAQKGAFTSLVETRSIFRQGADFLFVRSSFAEDLNEDGRYDLMIADFEGARLFLQQADGTFGAPILLPVEPEMRLVGRYSNDNISDTELAAPAPTTPAFSVFPFYAFDATGDGRQDIVYNIGVELLTFAQTDDGRFDTAPIVTRFPFEARGNRWIDQLTADERNADQSRFRDITVYRILDLDGDKTAEIVTVENKASGVFDREQSFSIYNGRIVDGSLTYGDKPDFTYALEGVGGVGFRDLNNDDRLDLAVTSVKLNIAKIVSVLVTRKMKVETRFHLNAPETGFRDAPAEKRSTLIGVDFSRGLTNNPVLEYADFNRDGALDLLTNDGDETLIMLKGGDAPFQDPIARLDARLPADGALVHALDVNDDGADDIVIRYSRLGLDGADNRSRLMVFLSE